MTHWHLLTKTDGSDENLLRYKAIVQRNSPWFSGHFPDDPILPGIAQLAMVFDAVKQVNKEGKKISEIRRVRFKQVIKPDDPIELTITPCPSSPDHYLFKIMVRSGLACSGTMIVERSQKNL